MTARGRRGLLVAGASALALAAAAPAADAATAYVTDDGDERVLHYEAAPGEVNRVEIAKSAGGAYELGEGLYGRTPLTIVPGAGCTALAQDRVSCAAAGLDRIEVASGDRDDGIRIAAADLPVRADGGDGDDYLDDPDAPGGAPARVFVGGPGHDLMRAPADATVAHDYLGGPGDDTVDYIWRSAATSITPDDTTNDGGPGEGDNVRTDIEHVRGGTGPDSIVGTERDDDLVGNGGADSIEGHGGADKLDASLGCEADVLVGGGGDDTLQLGGATEVHAGKDNDTILTDFRTCPDGDGDEVFGGFGTDSADFGYVYTFLAVSLDDVADDGVGGFDNFHSDVENVAASAAGMVMIGSDGPNVLTGRSGHDVLAGGGGSDQLVGGEGVDLADYSERSEPLDLSLNGAADDGEPGRTTSSAGMLRT